MFNAQLPIFNFNNVVQFLHVFGDILISVVKKSINS